MALTLGDMDSTWFLGSYMDASYTAITGFVLAIGLQYWQIFFFIFYAFFLLQNHLFFTKSQVTNSFFFLSIEVINMLDNILSDHCIAS